MQNFKDLPRQSEEERSKLYELLDAACTLVRIVETRIEGTYDGAMSTNGETTVADYLWPCIALSDARDELLKPKALKGKEKRDAAKGIWAYIVGAIPIALAKQVWSWWHAPDGSIQKLAARIVVAERSASCGPHGAVWTVDFSGRLQPIPPFRIKRLTVLIGRIPNGP